MNLATALAQDATISGGDVTLLIDLTYTADRTTTFDLDFGSEADFFGLDFSETGPGPRRPRW